MSAWLLAFAQPALAAPDHVRPPVVTVGRESRRRGGGHWLRLAAPEGLKLDRASPVEVSLYTQAGELTASLPADAFAPGLPVGDLGTEPVEGTVRAVLCTLDTNVCTRSAWALGGTAARRGSERLVVSAQAEAPHFGPGSDLSAVDQAFAAAAESGRPVLLDFSAVWCPPCMQLAAEVLDAESPPLVLDELHVAVVDVDHPSSFGLKDRYDVGGYPTSIVVTPDGTELARMLGFPGREAYVDWLATAAASPETDDLDPAELSPERAVEVALMRWRGGDRDEARRFVDSAAQRGLESADLRVARALLAPAPLDVEWLIDNAPDRVFEVRYTLDALDDGHPGLVDRATEAMLDHAAGLDLVEALAVRAVVLKGRGEDGEVRRVARYAANLLSAVVEQDARAGKAHLTWLADLWRDAGRLDRAVALLEEASTAHPTEPTFDLSLARLLVEEERPADALVAAERAASRSWGDIALRVALWHGRALVALERSDEAARVVEQALAPTDGLDPERDVRTHRYRQRLSDWWSEVTSGSARP